MGLTLDQVHKVNELAKTLRNTGFAANMEEAAKIAENILFGSGLEKRQEEQKTEVKINEPVKDEIEKIKWVVVDKEEEPKEKIRVIKESAAEEPVPIEEIEPVKEEQEMLSNFEDFNIAEEKEKTLKELFEESGEIVEEPEFEKEKAKKAEEETGEGQKAEETEEEYAEQTEVNDAQEAEETQTEEAAEEQGLNEEQLNEQFDEINGEEQGYNNEFEEPEEEKDNIVEEDDSEKEADDEREFD